jgi:glycosyltransferase involved in cell wall biosynthesis
MVASSNLRQSELAPTTGQRDAAIASRDRAGPPLTVALIGDYAYPNGGQAKAMLDSAIGLKRAGARPIVFAAVGPPDTRLAAERIETVCLDQLDMRSRKSKTAALLQGVWNFEASKALTQVLGALPDENAVVHLHGYAKALSASVKTAIAARGLPAAFTLHDYFLMCPNGGLYNYQAGHVCDLKPLSRACVSSHCDMRSYGRKLWRVARQLIAEQGEPLSGIFSDLILVTRFQREAVGPLLPPARQHILSNPIDVPDLGPRASPGAGGFVFVGRLSQEKGPLIFAEAAKRAGVTATFIGDGPLRGEIAAKYPEARVEGWKTPEIVQAILRDARALVFPSVWYEAQGLAVLEAKALGVRVIVSVVCAARHEIDGGRAGLLFKSGDADSLAEALVRLGDEAFALSLSRAAHQSYWAAPRGLQRHVDGLMRIYRGMVRARRAARA